MFYEDFSDIEVIFSENAMRKFVKEDNYLKFMFKDLISKGQEEKDALEILFNENVLEDSGMTAEYNKYL